MDYAIFIINNAEILLRISIMQYNLQLDRDADAEIVVKQLTTVAKNTKMPLTLFGQGRPNYGQELQNNFFYLLENFCGEDAPLNPVVGMLWYDSALKYLKLYTGQSYPRGPWVKVEYIPSGTASSTTSLTNGRRIVWTCSGLLESSVNPGVVSGMLYATLEGTTFKSSLVYGTDFNITGLPTGLVPNITSTSTIASISFTGSAPTYTLNTAKINIVFNITAFSGLTGNVSEVVGNYTHDEIITFFPNSLPITPLLVDSFAQLSYFTLKDTLNNIYDVFVDTANYGSYVVYDSSKTMTDTGTLIELNNALGSYNCITIPKNLISSSDNSKFSQITELTPKTIGAIQYKLINYTVNTSGNLYATVDTSLATVSITKNIIKIDDNNYIMFSNPNGKNATQYEIYDATTNTTANYPSTALTSSEYNIIDTPNNGYYLNAVTHIIKNSTYELVYSGNNDSGNVINYYISNQSYNIFGNGVKPVYQSNNKLSKSFVTFDIADNEIAVYVHNTLTKILTKSFNVGISTKPAITNQRIPSAFFKSFEIVDVIYCGQNTGNDSDVFGVLIINNNKTIPIGYQVFEVTVKNNATIPSTDVTMTSTTISTYSTNTLLLNTVAPSDALLCKLFYNTATKTFGLFYKG